MRRSGFKCFSGAGSSRNLIRSENGVLGRAASRPEADAGRIFGPACRIQCLKSGAALALSASGTELHNLGKSWMSRLVLGSAKSGLDATTSRTDAFAGSAFLLTSASETVVGFGGSTSPGSPYSLAAASTNQPMNWRRPSGVPRENAACKSGRKR